MIDHHHRVAVSQQVAHNAEQAVDVGGVQADGGLVQHVEHAGGAIAHGTRQLHALAFAGGQRGACAIERQIAQSQIKQPPRRMLERLADGDRHGAQVLGKRLRDAVYPGHGLVERHLARLRQVYPAHERASRRRRQARALAIRARPLGQEAGHARQALLVLRFCQRVLHGVDGVVVGEVEFGEVVAFLRLVQNVALFGGAVEDDVAFLGRELGKRHVKAYAHLAAHLLHEVPHQASPGKHGALVDGFALVGDQRGLVHAPHGAGAAAGGAGAAAVEGKLLGAGPEEGLSAGCARDRLLGGHRHGERGVGAAVRARVAAHAAEQQAQAV